GAANVISGNGQDGVLIMSGSFTYNSNTYPLNTSANVVLGNLIGTDRSGTAALGNGSDGVFLTEGAAQNTIGGTVGGAGNVIGFNGEGIVLGSSSAVQDSFLGNSIF